MTPISAQEDIAALWLHTLQRAIGRASHDVKDALNGVSVNLEVIRSRAARPDAPARSVAQFGEAAGQQLERLTTLIEAVLALGRAEREPSDVAVTLQRIGTVCGASASSSDAAILVDVRNGGESALTGIPSDIVRLAITAPLLEIVSGTDRAKPAGDVTCTLGGDEKAVHVVIGSPNRRATIPEAVADALRAAGVRWTEREQELTLTFRRA
jgi:signal transduction histidine kinase